MFLIGENINITSPEAGPALQTRDAAKIKTIAQNMANCGADVIDLNIGPARKNGPELMAWLVNTVQSATGKILSLDTTNLDAMEAGLKAGKKKIIMNSVSLQSSRLERGLEMAQRYHADIIGLLWSNEGMPRDVNERAMYTVDLVYKANQAGIGNDRIWIDPIVSPVTVDINHVKACIDFMQMLPEIAPGCKSTIGLSNISNGAPAELRCWLNRTFLAMIVRYGLTSAIVDIFDPEIIAIDQAKRPNIITVIWKIMDGETPDLTNMTQEMRNYAKTAKVLMGETLYSDSWLDI